MKKFSVTSFVESIFKNKLPVAAFALLLMILAASSILFCEKEIPALEKKWRSFCQLNEARGYPDNKAVAGGQPRDLTRYDIQVSLTRFGEFRAEIRLCDQYSFVLPGNYMPSGVYYKNEQGRETYVSTAEYPQAPRGAKPGRQYSQNHHLRFKCDLVAKTVLVYMNGKFMEKILLGPRPIKGNFGLTFPRVREGVMLNKLEISDPEGRVLFSVNFFPLFFYKAISQASLFFGVLIFLALGCSEKRLFRKALLFVFPLFFLEVFLRTAYPHDPGLDIGRLKPKWQFEVSTNFFGAFNDPDRLTIRSYLFGAARRTYLVANPEHATRILCAGSCPLELGAPSPDQAFPALLEKKLDAWNGKKNMVIPIAIPGADSFYDVETNIFLKEVINKINPDFLLCYGRMTAPETERDRAQFEKDYALYRRAKRVLEKNSDWIKNDRLLYAALEFKEPVKEAVYLYDFLCKSYLFMAVENIRKRFMEAWRSRERAASVESPGFLFEEVLALCKKKGIKVVFIPQLNFLAGSNNDTTEMLLAKLRQEHPEIYYLSLEGIFKKNENFLLAKDPSHPSEYGHEVMAEEIFRQLTEN